MKKYNFCAGPAQPSQKVLQELQKAIISIPHKNISILGVSHRDPWFIYIMDQIKTYLRELLKIDTSYEILFCHGGASLQFSIIPMYFSNQIHEAFYFVNGYWGEKAYKESKKYIKTTLISNRNTIEKKNITSNNYLYYVSNETIEGIYNRPFKTEKPIMCDMTSDILSRPIDVSKYHLIFFGTQKNMGTSGLSIVVLKKKLIKDHDTIPKIIDYNQLSQNNSLVNTPNVFAIYSCYLTLKEYFEKKMTIDKQYKLNLEKANLLYDVLDQYTIYQNSIIPQNRSIMNVTFHLPNEKQTEDFINKASLNGFLNIKGHRSFGGIRISIYNSIPIEAVEKLCGFMKNYAKNVTMIKN